MVYIFLLGDNPIIAYQVCTHEDKITLLKVCEL